MQGLQGEYQHLVELQAELEEQKNNYAQEKDKRSGQELTFVILNLEKKIIKLKEGIEAEESESEGGRA